MNKVVKMRTSKNRKKKNQMRAKTNLKIKMKNLILQSLKTIIRTLKESEKYANMTKKLKSIQRKRVILKSKEIRSIPRSKTSPLRCQQLRNNWRYIKRKNCWRSIKSMSVCQSVSHRSNIMWKSTISYDFKKILRMQSYLPGIHSIGLEKGLHN